MNWTHALAFAAGFSACLLFQALLDLLTDPKFNARIHDDEGHR